MSRVLLIEPHRVLQQALALSLFPEHEVRVEETIEAGLIGALREVDLLIVDAAALRIAGKLTADLQRGLEAVKTPTVWIDDDDKARPKSAKVAVIKSPIASGELQTAVAELLSGRSVKPKKAAAAKAEDDETPHESGAQLIDLVEVVEEAPDKTK